MCKFSIIIANYNKGKYIAKCLDSIFSQDIKKEKYEVIIVDDGSTDESVDIINSYDIKLFNTCRKGAGGARNLGIEKSSGEYIVFVDSDDYLTQSNVLSKLDKMINNQDIIFFNFTKDSFEKIEFLEDKKESMAQKIENTKFLACTTKCFKKSLIGNIRFPEECAYEDVNFTLECICKCKICDYFTDSFYTYRKVENSNTTQEVNGKIMVDVFLEISRLYYLCFKYPQYKTNILQRIKNDRLRLRLDLLDELIENGKNNFRKYF